MNGTRSVSYFPVSPNFKPLIGFKNWGISMAADSTGLPDLNLMMQQASNLGLQSANIALGFRLL
jgi:hypothetical protein